MAARGRRVAVGASVAALLAVTAGACSGTGASVRGEDTPQISLYRGGRWSVLSLKPPHLTGPMFNMLLKDGVLTGTISGGTAPGGALHISIAEDGADGHGPLGPVSMDFITDHDSTVAEGMWNGHRVHLVFRRDSIKGTVADNSDVMTRTDREATRGMPGLRNRSGQRMAGADSIDPLPRNSSCEYFLTETSPDGALTGGSICSGMPQPTKLEVPKMAQAYLTRPELVTVLVAVLSAPPPSVSEESGPRFDTSPPPPPEPPPVIRRK